MFRGLYHLAPYCFVVLFMWRLAFSPAGVQAWGLRSKSLMRSPSIFRSLLASSVPSSSSQRFSTQGSAAGSSDKKPMPITVLSGFLGAGKTSLVRHLLRALGVSGRIKSPTYAVLEPHQAGDLAISHFDFYRFTDPREWVDAGFREVFAEPGLKLAEWPENAQAMLPVADLRLYIEANVDDSRSVRLEAGTMLGLALF
jgi:tRNA threonylcarbamoyladenosine biosynthesis protein TsaE